MIILQKVFEPLIIKELPLLSLLGEILSLSLIWASRGKDHAGNHKVRMEVREAIGGNMERARIRAVQFIPESTRIIWFVPVKSSLLHMFQNLSLALFYTSEKVILKEAKF